MLISSHEVYECFHTTTAECFQQRLPILHLKYWLSVAWQKHFTHLGLDSQAQIPEKWKETSALLNEMQPLPKHLFFLPKTTNLPIIPKLEQTPVTGGALVTWPKVAAREAEDPNNTHSSTFARTQSRQGQMQKGVPESREAKTQHIRVIESEVRGHNHNPNESGIAVCSATGILFPDTLTN